jgi:CO/xanthine dehydrogenase Mo-binding subunit
MSALPQGLQDNPRLGTWISFEQPGIVEARSGKVELGQGVLTVFAQIAVEELDVPLSAVRIVSGDTERSPNEGLTAGSMSIPDGAAALRLACAQARAALLEAAAKQLGARVEALSIADARVTHDGVDTGLDCWSLKDAVDWTQAVDGVAKPRWRPEAADQTALARIDLKARISGAAFIQDLEVPGMVHGRVVHPPALGARLQSVDEAALRAAVPLVALVRSGDFLAVACEREEDAIRAIAAARRHCQWSEAEPLPPASDWAAWLVGRTATTTEYVVAEGEEPTTNVRLSRSYSRPPIAHATIGPSCALALFENGRLKLWSHSQGVFNLRGGVAQALGLTPEDVSVQHVPGAGCYGHNGADDAALDAALLARAIPGRTVRMQWMRDDELAWSPLGAPSTVSIDAALDNGRIVDWKIETWSGPHVRRSFGWGNPNLLSASLMDPPIPLGPPWEVPLNPGPGGGHRNAIALYDVGRHRLVHNFVPDLPFRTSSLRSLGAHANVFAIECFMDELAEAAGADPIQFRIDHLRDERAAETLRAVADLAGWDWPNEAGTEGIGRGVGFARYKNSSGYAAVICEAEVEEEVRITRVWCAYDAGATLNPDGLANQVEGGILQSISWTLKEAAPFDAFGPSAKGWEDYPILTFPETPRIMLRHLNYPEAQPLGAGEVTQGPAAAAVANAVARAIGVRPRKMPLTRDAIVAAMEDLG